MPVSRTAKLEADLGRSTSPVDLDRARRLSPLSVNLIGVADQVDQHLAQPPGSPTSRRARRARRRRPARGPSAAPAAPAIFMRLAAAASRRSKSAGSSSSLPASILEKSRMSLMTASRASAPTRTISEILALLGRQLGVEQQLGHADDAVHRRADLVAHVGQELALGPAGGLGGLLGLLELDLGLFAFAAIAAELVGDVQRSREGDGYRDAVVGRHDGQSARHRVDVPQQGGGGRRHRDQLPPRPPRQQGRDGHLENDEQQRRGREVPRHGVGRPPRS